MEQRRGTQTDSSWAGCWRVNGIQDGGDDEEEEDRGLDGLSEANWSTWAT
jgi:hypothetical protein